MQISRGFRSALHLALCLYSVGCAVQKSPAPLPATAVPSSPAALPVDASQLRYAIAVFFGFYSVNADTRMNYCRGLGVDISLFVIDFTQANLDVYQKATSLGKQYQVNENAIFFEGEKAAVAGMDENMAQRAAAEHITPTELCDKIRYNPEVVASNLLFSTLRPEIYQILMEQR